MIIKKLDDVPSAPLQGYDNVKKQIVIGPDDDSREIVLRYFSLKPGGESPHHTHDFPHLVKIETGNGLVIDETGNEHQLQGGDYVYIETKRGRIKQQANLIPNIDPRVIIVDYGWWFPEKSASEDLHGWAESNINILTDNKQPYASEMGSPTLRGILCKVYVA